MQVKVPLGVLILGGINCFILGLLSLLFSITGYFAVNQEVLDKIMEILKNKGILVQITLEQFKTMSLVSILVSLFFFISGFGLILKKELARKFTIYFSFILLFLSFLSVLVSPAFIGTIIINVVYYGILILYFTNSNIQSYFRN